MAIVAGFCLTTIRDLKAGTTTRPQRPVSAASTAVKTININGLDYVAMEDVAARFGLKATWLVKNERMALRGALGVVEVEADSRETTVNGLRTLLCDPVRKGGKSLCLSSIDLEKFIAPILRPGVGQTPQPRPLLIALDPGHGGKDSGKVNEKLKVMEKTFALDVALRLKKLLETQGYQVVLTRPDDRFVELADRPEIARKAGADLFISLHFNSVEQGADRVTGIEVFSLTPQFQFSTDDSGRTGVPDTKLSNPGNVADHWNTVLAHSMQRALIEGLKVPDRGHKRQRFKVLRLASCPAVLIESGYLSNDAEAKKVATPAYRQQIAEAVAEGVSYYVARITPVKK